MLVMQAHNETAAPSQLSLLISKQIFDLFGSYCNLKMLQNHDSKTSFYSKDKTEYCRYDWKRCRAKVSCKIIKICIRNQVFY